MHQKRRARDGSQNRTTPSDDSHSREIATVANKNLDYDLGELHPDQDTPIDLQIHAQINTDSEPSQTKDNSDSNINVPEELSNREMVSEFRKQQNEASKSRYDKYNQDGFEFDYDDFDIEDPRDGKLTKDYVYIVQVDIWRGVGPQKDERNEEYKSNPEVRSKTYEDQGGVVPDNNPDKDEIEYPEEYDDVENDDDNEDLTPESPMNYESKYVQNKFSNYERDNQNLDGSTVVIADITPSENEIRNMVPESPMIDKKTKEKLKTLGQSLDSKQINQAIGNIDMRRLCKCFAKAICKHISFSEGFLFLDDLKTITKEIYKEHGINDQESIK